MTKPPAHTSEDLLAQGQTALREGAWDVARSSFRAHVAGTPESAEAWEGLGVACYWLQDTDQLFEARQQAYRRYRQRGDVRSAARVASWLAGDFLEFRGEAAVAGGWIERARQLLEGTEPSADHAIERAIEAHLALMARNDPGAALRAATEARMIAIEMGGIDQEILARASEGLALVASGEVADGLRRLDGAAAAALGGEMTDLHAMSITCCYVIHACERVRDFSRATEWCTRFEELCERRHLGKFLTFCQMQHGTLLLWQGRWRQAEAELTAAREDAERARPSARAGAVVRLGELRRRQGRWDEADALLEETRTHPRAALWRAALALDRGDVSTAEDLAMQALRRAAPSNVPEHVGPLELIVLARIARGDLEGAEEARRDLDKVAAAVGTDSVRAAALFAAGVLALEEGKGSEARRLLQDAADLYEQGPSPYEAATARLALARVLFDLGRRSAAAAQARNALDTYRKLGAAEAQRRALEWVERIGDRNGRGVGAASSLTPRQIEVLRLVANGLSNREIGERLSVSEHTVRRHLANVYTRLDVSSRAAAVAQALRDGML